MSEAKWQWAKHPNEQRDGAIVRSLAAGVPAVLLAKEHGVCRQRIYQIRGQERIRAERKLKASA